MPLIAIALLAALTLVLPGGAAASPERARWRRPLPGAVVGSFSFDRAAPYERGRRRGIDLAGHPGEPVVAACSGVVTHAGAVPGWGSGVTLRCGDLVATELGLARTAVRDGAVVLRGAPVGRLAAGGLLRLGARRAGDRQGYVDPATLLEPTPPWGAAPSGRSARRGRPRAAAAAARAWAPAPAVTGASALPSPAWGALALVAAGAGGAGRRGARRRRPARTEALAAQR